MIGFQRVAALGGSPVARPEGRGYGGQGRARPPSPVRSRMAMARTAGGGAITSL